MKENKNNKNNTKNKTDKNTIIKEDEKVHTENTKQTSLVNKERMKEMPTLLELKSISAVKQEFTSVVREVLKGHEVIAGNAKSKHPDTVSIISTQELKYWLDYAYKFHPTIVEDKDGLGYTISLDEIMVFGDGLTEEEAWDDLIDNVIDYATLYFDKPDFYKQISERRQHYPYLRRIAYCTNREEVMEVLSECLRNSSSEKSKLLQRG